MHHRSIFCAATSRRLPHYVLIAKKLDSLGYSFVPGNMGLTSTTVTYLVPKGTDLVK